MAVTLNHFALSVYIVHRIKMPTLLSFRSDGALAEANTPFMMVDYKRIEKHHFKIEQ